MRSMCDKGPGVLRNLGRLRRPKGGGSQDWLPHNEPLPRLPAHVALKRYRKLAISLPHHGVNRFQLREPDPPRPRR
jgi:hypothetical protein